MGRVSACEFGPKDGHASRFTPVVLRKVFCKSEIEPQELHRQQKKAKIVEMDRLQIVFKMVESSNQRHCHNQCRNPGKYGPGDEIGPEDGAVPHGLDGHGKDIRNDRMDGNRNHDHKDRQERNTPIQSTMLMGSAAPVKREHLIEPLRLKSTIPQNSDIGNHAYVKKEGAGSDIDPDTYDIPHEGGLELRIPKKVQHAVRPSQIEQYITHSEGENQDSYYFCRSSDRPSPFRLGKAENR